MRRMRMGAVAAAAALCAMLAASVGAQPSEPTPEQAPIQIATSQPLTGPLADIGVGLSNAAQLAIEEHGRVKGRAVTQAAHDSGCGDAAEAVAAAQAIVADTRNVAVVGEACSAGGELWIPVFEAAGVPVVSPAATRQDLPTYGPTMFNRVFVADPEGNAWHDAVMTLPSVQSFGERYEERFGSPAPPLAEMSYDATLTVLAALDRVARSTSSGVVIDRGRLAKAIRTTDGLLGVTCKITIDEQGNRRDNPHQLARCGATA